MARKIAKRESVDGNALAVSKRPRNSARVIREKTRPLSVKKKAVKKEEEDDGDQKLQFLRIKMEESDIKFDPDVERPLPPAHAVTLSRDIRRVRVSRACVNHFYGGGTQATFLKPSQKNAHRTGKTNFLMANTVYNPLAPTRPGMPGYFFTETDLEIDIPKSQSIQTTFIKIVPNEYLYLGEYKLKKSTPLTIEEWNNQGDKVKVNWGDNICKHKWGTKTRARVAFWKHYDRAPSQQELAEILKAERKRKKEEKEKKEKERKEEEGEDDDDDVYEEDENEDEEVKDEDEDEKVKGEEDQAKSDLKLDVMEDVVSTEDVIEALTAGKVFMNVYIMECISYDEVFQRHLAQVGPRFRPPPKKAPKVSRKKEESVEIKNVKREKTTRLKREASEPLPVTAKRRRTVMDDWCKDLRALRSIQRGTKSRPRAVVA